MDLRIRFEPLALALAVLVVVVGGSAAADSWSPLFALGGGGVVLLGVTALRQGKLVRLRGEREGTKAEMEFGGDEHPEALGGQEAGASIAGKGDNRQPPKPTAVEPRRGRRE